MQEYRIGRMDMSRKPMTQPARIVCFGELLLRLAAPGRELLLQSASLQLQVGGAEANVAVALRQLGHDSLFVSAVPDNALGRGCIAELRRHGVDVSGVQLMPGRMGLYFLAHAAGQRPAEVLYDRAESSFVRAAEDQFDWDALLAGADWLHISGVTVAVSAQAAAAALRAMRTARASGLRISFDCNFRAALWSTRIATAPALLRELAGHADLLFADARDFALMYGTAAADATRAPQERAFRELPTLQWIAATVRQRETMENQQLGGVLHLRSGRHESRAFALTGIVDRIGSGDAFAAAVIDGLIAGRDPQDVVDFGCAAATLKHFIPGDFNLSTREDILALLAGHTSDVRR